MTILLLGLLYFFAHFLSLTFDRTRVPDVLVLMILGIVVGPALHWTSPEAFGTAGKVVTTIALAVILFESGTGLRLSVIARSAGTTIKVTVITSLATIAVVGVVAHRLLDLPWLSALLLGTICSGVSSAVVIPMVRSLKVRERVETVMILESALTDVTSIVFTFALLQAASQGEVRIGPMVGQTLSALVFAAVIGVAGGIGWLLVWDRVRQFPTTIFTTLASAFVLYGLAEMLGFAGAIAVLAYGITLSNHESFGLTKLFKGRPFSGVTPVEGDFYAEIVFLLKTFFFVFLGISMRFTDARTFGIAVVITLAVYLTRLALVPFMAPSGTSRREASILALMVPKGLAAAVLAGLPLEAGIEGGAIIQITTYGIVLVSITVTAVVVALMEFPPISSVLGTVLRRFPEDATEPARSDQASV